MSNGSAVTIKPRDKERLDNELSGINEHFKFPKDLYFSKNLLLELDSEQQSYSGRNKGDRKQHRT